MADLTVAADLPEPGKTPEYAKALPATAVAKLMRLVENASDAHVAVAAFTRRVSDARTEWQRESARHNRLCEDFEKGYVIRQTGSPVAWDMAPAALHHSSQHADRQVLTAPDQARVDQSAREVASLKAELDRQSARLADLADTWQAYALPLQRIETYLREVRGSRFTLAAAPAGRARKASEGDISRQREAVAALKAELADVRAAPIPSKEAKKSASDLVLDLADRGAPKLFDLAAGVFRIEFPTFRRDVETHGRAGDVIVSARGSTNVVDPLALLAWLDPQKMIDALARDIDEIADDSTALDSATRAMREDEIEKKILAAEREEEALVEQALAAGLKVSRRLDADPRAILGIDGPALADIN